MEAEKTQKLHREDNSRFNSFKTMTSNSGTVMCVLSLLLSVGVLIRVETSDSRLETVESVLTKDSQNPVSRPLHQKKVLVEIQSSPPQGTDEKLKGKNMSISLLIKKQEIQVTEVDSLNWREQWRVIWSCKNLFKAG